MKRLLGFGFLFPVVLILVGALSTRVEAQRSFGRQSEDKVCFYTDDHYHGASFCANPGESKPNVGGSFNDKISSIRIYGHAEVTVFENENFGGARRTFTRDVANLHDLGWNDMITSFQVSGGERRGERGGYNDERRGREPSNGACFYMDENFGGQGFCLNSGEDDRNVGGHFNDRISSIRLFGRARVTVFTDENFRGNRREFDHDVRNLKGYNDQITSIRVR